MNVHPRKFSDKLQNLVAEDGGGEPPDRYMGYVSGHRCPQTGSEIVTECGVHFQQKCFSDDEGDEEQQRNFESLTDTVHNVARRSLKQNKELEKLKIMYAPCKIFEPQNTSLSKLKHLVLEECSVFQEDLRSLGALHHLEKLEIGECQMNIPNEIYRLPNLKVLKLTYDPALKHRFSPTYEQASCLQKLEELHLRGAKSDVVGRCFRSPILTPQICSILSLKELTTDSWGGKGEQTIPKEIGNLINLKVLQLGFCHTLVDLPSSIGNLKKLEELGLNNCSRLSNIPIEVWNLRGLKSFSLVGGMITMFPREISNLVNLRSLVINLPHLESMIHSETIRGLSKLEHLAFGMHEYPVHFPSILPPTLRMLSIIATEQQPIRNAISNLNHLSDCCPLLEHLDLSHCGDIVNSWDDYQQLLAKNDERLVSENDILQIMESLPATIQLLRVPWGTDISLLLRRDLPSGICCISGTLDAIPWIKKDKTMEMQLLLEKYHSLGSIIDFMVDHCHLTMRDTLMPLPRHLMFLMLMNKCGRMLLGATSNNAKFLPLGMWSEVFARAYDRVHGSVLYHKNHEKECNVIAASVIYSLLHCEALTGGALVRPNNARKRKVPPTTHEESAL